MQRLKLFLFAIVFITLALIVFPVPRQGGFVSDDWDWLSAAAKQPSLGTVFTMNSTGTRIGGSYNPVSSLWIGALYRYFGADPVPYHVASIVLHGINAFLVVLVCAQVVRLFFSHIRGEKFSLAVGFIFLLWPTHVEAVQWVAAVPHLLATCFMLLALHAYFSWKTSGARHGFWFTTAYCMGAFFSKETALTLPFILLCIEAWYQRHHLRSAQPGRRFKLVSVFCAAALYLVMRFFATGILLGTYAEQQIVVRPWQWINTFLTFFEEFATLGTAHVLWMRWYWHHPLIVAFCGFLVVISIWWRIIGLRNKSFLVWWHLLLISLLPFITLGFNRLSQEGERYTYLPSVFFLLCGATFLYHYARRFSYVVFILVICISLQQVAVKNAAWSKAFSIAAAIVTQAQALPKINDPSHLYIFVGLPDTVGGAQVFRNNIVEAIGMSGVSHEARFVHMPIYTQLQVSEVDSPMLHWTSHATGLVASNKDRRLVVTGFDRRETELLTYELRNYNYSFFSSDTIWLSYQDELKQRIDEGSASIITWDAGKLYDSTHSLPVSSSL